ncbi:putative pentatricopeptide repeat-containing protein [Nymphaea thermarum]|nr:putative pentatricopeptide repeat-containing protein [Nymphaea thermarum]
MISKYVSTSCNVLVGESRTPATISSLLPCNATSLLHSCFGQGRLGDGRELFDEMPDSHRDVVSWTTTITGYVSQKCYLDAVAVFRDMRREGVRPNAFTLSSTLKACSGLSYYWLGSSVHACMLKDGWDASSYVENALLDMYVKCNCMHDAWSVFNGIHMKTAVSWTTMIAGYSRKGRGEVAVQIFRRMLLEGVELNHFGCSIALRASGSIESLACGEQIHGAAIKLGYDRNIAVGNATIDMYAHCSRFLESRKLFDEMPQRDLITWNTMISAYEKFGFLDCLHVCIEMEKQGLRPNCFTFTSLVTACSNLTALACGQQVHGRAMKSGFSEDVPLANALIDLYAKSGDVYNSRRVFDEASSRDLFTWTSMLMGYGKHGYGNEAIELFNLMISNGVRPDHVAFLGILCACSHSGHIDYGLSQFRSMSINYSLQPKLEHYACVVDMLGRAGNLEEAFKLINSMPLPADESVWGALLAACRVHSNPSLGRVAAQKILSLRPAHSGTYTLLSNIHAGAGEWSEFARTRKLMKENAGRKEPGRSWIEVNNQVQVFVMGDTATPQMSLVYEELKALYQLMKEAGYVPHLDTSLHIVDDG